MPPDKRTPPIAWKLPRARRKCKPTTFQRALAAGAIRLSLGWASGEADVARFEAAFAETTARLRRRRGTAAHAAEK